LCQSGSDFVSLAVFQFLVDEFANIKGGFISSGISE